VMGGDWRFSHIITFAKRAAAADTAESVFSRRWYSSCRRLSSSSYNCVQSIHSA